MRKRIIIAVAAMLSVMQLNAQMSNQKGVFETPETNTTAVSHFSQGDVTKGFSYYNMSSNQSNNSFSRGKGFVIRPELYRGLFVNFGYQINPYIQTFACFGYGDGVESGLGLRAYTGDADWVAMFDLRFSLTDFSFPGTSLVAGASYKDLDFGAGVKCYTDGYYYLLVSVLTVGWNIRCYEHR